MTKEQQIEKAVNTNDGYLACLNDLMKFIKETKEGNGTPTAEEINRFFVLPKIQECSDRLESKITELNLNL